MRKNSIYSDAWCNLVFEGRNQAYGAYLLRKEAEKNTVIGIFTSLGVSIFILGFPLLVSLFDHQQKPVSIFKEIIYELDVFPEIKKPEVSKKMESTNVKKSIIPDFKHIQENHTKPSTNDPIQTKIIPGLPSDSIFIDENANTRVEIDSNSEDNKIYLAAGLEVFPEFPGGEEAMMTFFRNQVKYPHEAYLNDKRGIVYLSFIIGKDGRVSEITVLKGVKDEESFEREAIRVTKLMPTWKPGKQNGKEVAVRYTIPFTFEIK